MEARVKSKIQEVERSQRARQANFMEEIANRLHHSPKIDEAFLAVRDGSLPAQKYNNLFGLWDRGFRSMSFFHSFFSFIIPLFYLTC